MSNQKISQFTTVAYKGSLMLPAVDMASPVGAQNVSILASSLTGILGPTGPTGPGGGPTGPQGPPGDVSGGTVIATGSMAPRTLPDRFADFRNPKDFGAVMDGTTVDSTAMNAARLATTTNGTVYVPAGGWNSPVTPTGGPANGSVLWQLSGNSFGAGSTPVTSIGLSQDMVESFFNGTKYFGRQHNKNNPSPAVRIDYTLDTAGGTAGWVGEGLLVNSQVNANVVDSAWGILSKLTIQANNNNFWPQPVGIATQVFKQATAHTWGMGCWIDDSQGLRSSLGGGINGMEMSITVNDVDDANGSGGGARRFFDLIAATHGTGAAGEVANGVLIRSALNNTGYVRNAFHTLGSITNSFVCEAIGQVGLDTSLATLSGSAVRLAAEQKLSLKSDDNRYLQYTTLSGTPRLRYMVGPTEAWSVSDTGMINGGSAGVGMAVRSDVIPAQHLSNLIGKTSAIVVIIGDSTATGGPSQSGISGGTQVGNAVDETQTLWAAICGKLRADNPQITNWTFLNYAIGGTAENGPLFTGIDLAVDQSLHPWFTDLSQIWLSYPQAANPDVLFYLFGTNSSAAGTGAGNGAATFIRQNFEAINAWTYVPNIVLITNKSSNPATDTTPGPDDTNSSNHKAQAAFHRTFAQSNGSGYITFPNVVAKGFGLIDLGRYFTARIDGHDPVIQYFAARSSYLVTGMPLGIGSSIGTDASTVGYTTGGDFRLTFVLPGAGGDTIFGYGGGNAIRVSVSKFTGNYVRLIIGSGGTVRPSYVLDGNIAGNPTSFGTTVSTSNGQDVVITVACSNARCMVTVNGMVALDLMVPRFISEQTGGTPINVNFPLAPTGSPVINVTEFYEGIPTKTSDITDPNTAFGTALSGNAKVDGFQGGNSINHSRSNNIAEDRRVIQAMNFSVCGFVPRG